MPRFGRIPQDTIELFERTVQDVKTKVIPALPSNADSAIRAYTMGKILEMIFRNWREKKNKNGMAEEDLRDLASFVQMSAALAGSQINSQGRPVFEATLRGLLDDWLENWNAAGAKGPPVEQGAGKS